MALPDPDRKNAFPWILPLVVTFILLIAVTFFFQTLGKEIQKLSDALQLGGR